MLRPVLVGAVPYRGSVPRVEEDRDTRRQLCSRSVDRTRTDGRDDERRRACRCRQHRQNPHQAGGTVHRFAPLEKVRFPREVASESAGSAGASGTEPSVAGVDDAEPRQRERIAFLGDTHAGALDQVEEEIVQLLRRRTLVRQPPRRQDSPRLFLTFPAALEVTEEPARRCCSPSRRGISVAKLTHTLPHSGAWLE